MRSFVINKNDSGQRLDKFVTKSVGGLPQSLMYKFIRTKKIKLNKKRAEPSVILNEGDLVEMYIKDAFFESPEADTEALFDITPKLDILYEDENIILLNKRPGVLVHEDEEGRDNTLLMHLKAYLVSKGEYDPSSEASFAPALCNRIDRNTGGIVIGAKNAAALREMNAMIRDGKVSKYYLCAVHGIMPKKEDILKAYLKKDSRTNTVDISDRQKPGYREIVTGYRVLSEKRDRSLLEVRLYTGRTHQIRAHLSHIGHPLVGDGKYGQNRDDRRRGYKYQALYSYKVAFGNGGEGELGYLDGRSFSLPRDSVWFSADFFKPENDGARNNG
ncbi:MAG: RluA family pseudouridine synthase [Clostridia bacterium]|jgi:23S rRNA pseudouridine955/2504/2580 synthase|nr:RluA family pseudouridine synthase [Clostridia bacterium]